MNIFVGNIEYSVSEEELKKAFEEYGKVDSARIITNRHTGRSKGFGFVVMPDDSEAGAAMEALHEKEINGRPLIVNEARRSEEDRAGFGRENDTDSRSDTLLDRERGRRDRY